MTLPKDSRNTRCRSAGPIASSAADIRPTADPADRSSTHAHAANGATTLLIGTSPTCTQLWVAPRPIRKTAAFGSTVRHRSGPTALRDLRPPAARHCRADGSAPGGRRRSPDLRTDADLPRRGRTTEAESLIARPRRPSPRPWPVTRTPLAGTRSPFTLSSPVLAPTSLPETDPKSARATSHAHTDQRVICGQINLQDCGTGWRKKHCGCVLSAAVMHCRHWATPRRGFNSEFGN